MFSFTACDNPSCQSADLDLSVWPIDTGLSAVEWDEEVVRQVWAAPVLPEDLGPVRCTVDVCYASIEPSGDTDFARDVTLRLSRLLRPALLEQLHEELCAARGLPHGMQARLPEGYQSGDLVPWWEIWSTVRLDLIDAGGRTWVAMDHHSLVPGGVRGAVIDFLQFEMGQRRLETSLGLVVVESNGNYDLQPRAGGGAILRDAWRALAARFGDVPKELERRRQLMRKVLGPLVRDAPGQKPALTASGAGGDYRASSPSAAAPGRNDRCPCGSGRKYKRCCALRATR